MTNSNEFSLREERVLFESGIDGEPCDRFLITTERIVSPHSGTIEWDMVDSFDVTLVDTGVKKASSGGIGALVALCVFVFLIYALFAGDSLEGLMLLTLGGFIIIPIFSLISRACGGVASLAVGNYCLYHVVATTLDNRTHVIGKLEKKSDADSLVELLRGTLNSTMV